MQLNYKNAMKYNKPFFISFVQFLLSIIFKIDKSFFEYEQITDEYIIVKIIYLLLLLIFWSFVFFVAEKIKEKDVYYLRWVRIFCEYFFIMMLILLVLWPGTWVWDDISTLGRIEWYSSFDPWQHIITGIYYDVLLQTLPFPGGIILQQNLIISICVAYIVTMIENMFGINKSKALWMDLLELIPFLMPPVLLYQFSGYRMGIYVYLELLMIVKAMSLYMDDHEWRRADIVTLCFLCVLIAAWRAESFVYIPFIGILIVFAKDAVLSRYKKVICLVVLIIGFCGINRWQSHELGDSNYQVISLLCPGAEVVRAADYSEDAEELAIIDKVTDIEIIRNNPEYSGEMLYWSTGCVRNLNDDLEDDYTESDYKNYLKAFIKLSMKYPKAVLDERWKQCIKWAGGEPTGDQVMNGGTATIFYEGEGNAQSDIALGLGWFAFKPLSRYVRKVLIYIMTGRKLDGTVVISVQRVLWNAFIPISVLILCWLSLLIKKKWALWLLCSAVISRIPIVFLTQPAGWFMYVLSFYFLGYVCLVYMTILSINRIKETSGNE